MTEKRSLLLLLNNYHPEDSGEKQFKERFFDLLEEPFCFERKNLRHHFTGSCWVTDPTMQYVLLLHHAKLQRWLQPGGHADGDPDLINVAWKELMEETGIRQSETLPSAIFDIDIHRIPERKNIPAHEHFDARFHFIAKTDLNLRINKESTAFRWVPIDKVVELTEGERSFQRMVNKTKAIQK